MAIKAVCNPEICLEKKQWFLRDKQKKVKKCNEINIAKG